MSRLLLLAIFVTAIIVGLNVAPSEGKVISRLERRGPGLHYLGKFCFDKGVNSTQYLTWQSWTKTNNFGSNVYAVMFDDQSDSWPSVEGSKDCNKILSRAKKSWLIGDKQYEKIHVSDNVRPRYWYIALFECSSETKEVYELEYHVEFVNGGGWWENQFSFDAQGMLATFLTLAIIYTFFFILTLLGVLKKIHSHRLSHLFRLYFITIGLLMFSFWSLFIDNSIYADDGRGTPGLAGFGQILDLTAMFTFVYLLLLMAKGWMVTTDQLTGRRVLVLCYCFFMIIYISFFLWDNLGIDEQDLYSIYETTPSVLNLVLRFLMWILFVVYIVMTWRRDDTEFIYAGQSGVEGEMSFNSNTSKRGYCIILGVAGTVWFLSLPFFVLVGLAAPVYDRYKTTAISYLGIAAVVHLMLGLWLYIHDAGHVNGGNTWLGGFSLNDEKYVAEQDVILPHEAPGPQYNTGRVIELKEGVNRQSSRGNDNIMDNRASLYDTL